uniref:Ubiquitin-like protease family profile domain-containing protein n=1 Tax=viral metagenome TaxID=1070528 RepID=A0A6C0HU20_9ZZZZ
MLKRSNSSKSLNSSKEVLIKNILTKPLTIKKITIKNKTMKSRKPMIVDEEYRDAAVSWVLHSIKDVLGLEDNRKEVIKRFIPNIPNEDHIRTFDAYVEYETGEEDKKRKKEKKGNKEQYDTNYELKLKEIRDYCTEVMQLENYVVFTATNIEEFQEYGKDSETHYQTFIVDNIKKVLYVIDPAKKNGKEYGIYIPQVAIEIIMPFFRENEKNYKTKFVKLKFPAQTNDSVEEADIFCQSWSLYILIEFLKDNNKDNLRDITINIPESQKERYNILLKFFKDVFSSIPSLQSDLKRIFEREIQEGKPDKYKKFINIDPYSLLMDMKTSEMS